MNTEKNNYFDSLYEFYYSLLNNYKYLIFFIIVASLLSFFYSESKKMNRIDYSIEIEINNSQYKNLLNFHKLINEDITVTSNLINHERLDNDLNDYLIRNIQENFFYNLKNIDLDEKTLLALQKNLENEIILLAINCLKDSTKLSISQSSPTSILFEDFCLQKNSTKIKQYDKVINYLLNYIFIQSSHQTKNYIIDFYTHKVQFYRGVLRDYNEVMSKSSNNSLQQQGDTIYNRNKPFEETIDDLLALIFMYDLSPLLFSKYRATNILEVFETKFFTIINSDDFSEKLFDLNYNSNIKNNNFDKTPYVISTLSALFFYIVFIIFIENKSKYLLRKEQD